MFTGTRPCTCKRRHRDRHLCDASSTNVSDTQVKSVRAAHREVSWFDPRDDQECVDHKLHLHRIFDQDAAACCDEHSRRIKSTSTVSLECNQSTRRVLESLPLSRLPSASLSLSLSTQRLVLLLQLLFFFPLLLFSFLFLLLLPLLRCRASRSPRSPLRLLGSHWRLRWRRVCHDCPHCAHDHLRCSLAALCRHAQVHALRNHPR